EAADGVERLQQSHQSKGRGCSDRRRVAVRSVSRHLGYKQQLSRAQARQQWRRTTRRVQLGYGGVGEFQEHRRRATQGTVAQTVELRSEEEVSDDRLHLRAALAGIAPVPQSWS